MALRGATTYCIVPWDLAGKLHEPLRRHFQDDPAVRIVVERRGADRRATRDRRDGAGKAGEDERRAVRAADGRRVADRRVSLLPAEPLPLPGRARPHADRLLFVERIEPSSEHAEDVDTARLVARIQGGDHEAFSDLYLRYFDRVYAYLHVILNDPRDAEDATQQVFLKVLEAIRTYERRRGRPFRAWLFVIARNYGISEIRRRSRGEPHDPAWLSDQLESTTSNDDSELSALSWLTDRELMMFVERLPMAQRQVLVLRYMLDMGSGEIAEVLDLTPNTVRMLQHRAQTFLRQRLTALGREPRHSGRLRNRVRVRQAIVLRERRFALLR